MQAPAFPADERERLAALNALHLLDTPPEERFDRIVRLATRLFGVPIAYVALVDADRQWFKACCGLSDKQTSREISFCGHAILEEDTLVVPDTRLDPRFADNPLVTGEPFLRFYAGQPLAGPGGHKVGTFCLADRNPRTLSSEDLQTLRDLAGLVERELNLTDVILLQNDLLQAQERAAEAERAKTEYLGRLVDSQRHLSKELEEAAGYVRSLLPERLQGEVISDYVFQPCSQLGGDAFGYHWIDPDHLAIYLLDVCGHGVGAALLSISAMNTLRGQALPGVDFRDPAAVLGGLNRAYPMERHADKYFTIWYGVWDRATRGLRYATAGHPPAILRSGDGSAGTLRLGMQSFFIGLDGDTNYESQTVTVEPASKLFVFSDGAYELTKPTGETMQLDEFVGWLSAPSANGESDLARVLRHARDLGGADGFADDFSLLELRF